MPLSGLRVVDLTRILAGPFCSMLLADMDAHVIKIETPGEGDPVRRQGVVRYGLSLYFAGFNRNKRSLTLNLRHHEGCTVLEKLIAGSDVLVKNFRPGDLRGGCVLVAAGARERAAAYGQRRGPNRLAGGRRRAALALFAWRGGDRCRLGRLGRNLREGLGKLPARALVNLWEALNHSSRARRISATRCVRPVPLFRGQFEKDAARMLSEMTLDEV